MHLQLRPSVCGSPVCVCACCACVCVCLRVNAIIMAQATFVLHTLRHISLPANGSCSSLSPSLCVCVCTWHQITNDAVPRSGEKEGERGRRRTV